MVYIPEHIASLIPYRSGQSIEDIQKESDPRAFAKLASNENPLGPSKKVFEAISKQFDHIHLYPDSQSALLSKKLAETYRTQIENIAVGSGSDALLEHLMIAFSDIDSEVLTSEGTFIGFYVITKKLNRQLKMIPLKNWGYDLSGIAKATLPHTKIIYLANPNNPTGTFFDRQDWNLFVKDIPNDTLIIVDEAYFEYAQGSPDYPDTLSSQASNIVTLRTFSKAYALAGLRVGYALGHEDVITALKKVKLPFEPSRLAQVAALAALQDGTHLHETLELNRTMKEKLKTCLSEYGYTYVDSLTNFLMVVFDSESDAQDFTQHAKKQRVFVRHLTGFGIPQAVRISTGTLKQTDLAINAFQSFRR